MPTTARQREPRFDPRRFPPASREPRVLQTARVVRDPLDYLTARRRTLGPVFTLRILPYRGGIVCAADAATNREVLTDGERFLGGDAATLLEPLVGPSSLILTPAPRHLRNRRMLLPPFHGERVARWSTRVSELIAMQAGELSTGAPVAVRPWAQRMTLDVILRVVFGLEEPAQVGAFRAAIDRFAAPGMQALLFSPDVVRRDLGPLSPGRALARRRDGLDALIHREIGERRAAADHGDRDDVLSILLSARDEDGRGFEDHELRDELVGLVFAGHETTATALAWTLHLLAHAPRVRDALVDELDAGSDTLLKAVIKESMRLRPPVFDAIRTAAADTELAGRPVPKDAFVSALFCVTHLDPELWPDPLAFRPERHLGDAPVPYALTPFGGGVRRCIGAALAQLELEVALRELLARMVPEPAGPPEPVRLLGVTLVPARGGRVLMRPRSGSPRPAQAAATHVG
jgi:cytochrome P450